MTPEAGKAEHGLIAVLDAAYGDAVVAGACVLMADFESGEAVATRQICLPHRSAHYEPGAFYKRELPVLLALLDAVEAPLRAVMVDGYVHLDPDGRPGLGAHLAAAFDSRIPVIGVAKSPFRGDDWSRKLFRGESRRPLHVTATGLDIAEAAQAIEAMHGGSRIPTMCRLADRLARDALAGTEPASAISS